MACNVLLGSPKRLKILNKQTSPKRKSNTMKKIISLIAAIGLTFSSLAGLQIGSSLNGGTNNLPAIGLTNTFNLPGATVNTNNLPACSFACVNSKDIAFQLSGTYTNSSAGSATVVLTLAQSVDNVIWTNSTQTITLSMLAAATNATLNYLTTISNAAPFWTVNTLTLATNGAGAGALTNIYLKAWTKTGI